MKKLKTLCHIFFLFAVFGIVSVSAQQRRNIVSPEIHKDNTVTFRFAAPQAEQVELSGQFLSKNLSMSKDENGIWSVTTTPVKPDIYPYNFVVDGISANDPNNVLIFPNERFKGNLLDMPGNPPLIHSLQNVPHGRIAYNYYHSKSLDLERPLVIYTPPGYDENPTKKYPVLYLIHGMTDTHETWFKVGRVNDILDNLIAQKKAEPMIIVMPYANALPDLMQKNPGQTFDIMGTDLVTNEIMKEIIPYVEQNYRTLNTADKRAVAGFSLGGRQTLAAGLGNPDMFSYVCAFAPAIFGNGIDESFNTTYASADKLKKLKLLWVSCGKEDSLYQGSLALLDALKKRGIKYQEYFTPGGHTWMNCRIYLTEISQRLFKK